MRSKLPVLAIAVLFASVGSIATARATVSATELTASDAAAHDAFGSAVAISGKSAIVSAPSRSPQAAAYIFGLGPAGWTQQAELPGVGQTDLVNDGASVAIAGNVAVIGSIGEARFSGAYVFVRTKGVWRLRDHLHQVNDLTGYSVAISGTTIVVGSPQLRNRRNEKFGAAYVYGLDGLHWTLQATLTDPQEPPDYGWDVAIDGDTIVVGAPHFEGGPDGAGAAYVYRHDGASWVPDGTLQATTPRVGDLFGDSVGVSGGTAIVGASAYEAGGAGSAYVFTNTGSAWTRTDTLTDGKAHNYFGSQVAISRNRAVVGLDPGSRGGAEFVYLYQLQNGVAVGRSRRAPSDAGDSDEFGQAVSISGRRILVGAYGHSVDDATGAGAAYVFAR